jgi:hypothetical protein
MRRVLSRCVLLMAMADVAGARAQSGWEARAVALPNPVPAGKCSAVVVEPVDDHGYRRTTLSNGAALDKRNYTYDVSDKAHFVVHNDPAMWGYVCADSTTPSMSAIVTVTLPDGLKGTVQLFALAKGAPPARAVVYRPQAPLRLPSSPEYAPGFIAGRASGAGGAVNPTDPSASNTGAAISADPTAPSAANTGAANPADPTDPTDPSAANTGAANSADPTNPSAANTGAATGAGAASAGAAGGASRASGASRAAPLATSGTVEKLRHTSASVTTPALSLVGTYHALSAVGTTPALSLIGTYHNLSSVQTTPTLSLKGTYTSQPTAVTAPITTSPKPISPGAHSP